MSHSVKLFVTLKKSSDEPPTHEMNMVLLDFDGLHNQRISANEADKHLIVAVDERKDVRPLISVLYSTSKFNQHSQRLKYFL